MNNSSAFQALKDTFHGELITPGEESYDSARRVWNGMADKYPALIARCTDVSDVVGAVQFAHQQSLPVAVRSGGHSFAGSGTCDGGIVIDLSRMKDIQVDPLKRSARAQAGMSLGEFVLKTQAYGLTTPVGTNVETGLAGLTLGGGLGWLMGKYGLTLDNLLAVDIVTADGRLLTASATEHPDLFWAVRGGGGNFGIVTAFEFQLHALGQLLAGIVFHPVDQAREVLHFYQEFTSTAPDELTVYAMLDNTPDGRPALALAFVYCGPLEKGERVIEPIRKFGSPLTASSFIRSMSYYEIVSLLVAPAGRHYYGTTIPVKHLSAEAIETFLFPGLARTSPWTSMTFQHVHGAVCRVDPTETAFALRDERHELQIVTAWDGGTASEADRHITGTLDFQKAMQPFASGGPYLNYMSSEREDPKLVQASYGANYKRLVTLKKTYDPNNFFQLNQNIEPRNGLL